MTDVVGTCYTEVFRLVVQFETRMRVHVSIYCGPTVLRQATMPLALSTDLRWRAIWMYVVVQLPISDTVVCI